MDDGVNATFSYSWDRINWNLMVSQARTLGFTTAPDQIAFVWTAQSASVPFLGWLVSWEQTVPGITPGTGSIAVAGQLVTRTP